MRGLHRDRSHRAVSAADLGARADELAAAVAAGGTRLPADEVEQARALAAKIGERMSITGSRTVAALAGATGSGKSTLFNALVGSEVSHSSARRPTTRTATAAIWGPEPAGDLMDWLGVDARHHVPDTAPGADQLDGLVLLDLPDFDSRERAHRVEADRILGLVDVFVWVTDPQKYADAVLHDDYLRRLSTHDAVTVVVLNQVDRLGPEGTRQCVADLESLLVRDGLTDAHVIPVSAATGQGLPQLADAVEAVVQRRNAATSRLLADVRASATRLRAGVADREPAVPDTARDELTAALSRAAGVPVVVEAVRRDYLRRAAEHGGWPLTRWAGRLRPAPLRRLGLERPASDGGRLDLALGRSSLPTAAPADRAAVDVATRKVGTAAAAGLPEPWARDVEDAAVPGDASMHDALDQAIVATPLRDRDPAWWRVLSALQWLWLAAALAGLVWLLVLAVLGWAQIHLDVPIWGWVPIPLALLGGGLLAGFLTALLSRSMARSGARHRADRAHDRLTESIGRVAQTRVVAPVEAVLDDHRRTRTHLDAARS